MTKYRREQKKHIEKCTFIVMEREMELQFAELTARFEQQLEQVRAEHEAVMTAQRHELELTVNELRVENSALRAERNMLNSMLYLSEQRAVKAQNTISHLAERAIDKPTMVNQQVTNTCNVKVTNFLTDYKTYEERTEQTFVTCKARSNLIEYFMDGQFGLARFVVDCIIRCDRGMILCCTDPARKRFRFLNADGQLQEDLEARMLTHKLSIPIKMVAHEVFEEMCKSLEHQRQVKISEKAGTFEVGFVEKKIEMAHDQFFRIREFDLQDKNSDFLTELSGLLRGVQPAKLEHKPEHGHQDDKMQANEAEQREEEDELMAE